MLNVIELETRWKSYKIKSFLPHVVIAASVIVILIITLLFLKSDSQTNDLIKENMQIKELPTEEVKVLEKNITLEDSTKDTIHQEEVNNDKTNHLQDSLSIPVQKVSLSPSMQFINEMTNDTPFYQNSNTNYEQISHKEDTYNQEKYSKVVTEPNVETIVEEKPQAIKIERKDTHDDILKVIERFKKSNDPALSLFVAKKYYELGDYNKSYNYALITNELNNNIEASWIIFAKSLVKLKEKDMAVKTLRQYIEHSGSNQAKMLLEEIRSGKFK